MGLNMRTKKAITKELAKRHKAGQRQNQGNYLN